MRILLFLCTIGFCVLLLEGAVRYGAGYEPHAYVVPPEIGRFDRELGWALEPGSAEVSERIGYPIEYRINSQGLRDDEVAIEKPVGERRIAFIGDSNTFGFGCPIEKHFTRLIEGYFPNLEGVNLGVSGYGADQELLRLRRDGLAYSPDVVVLFMKNEYPDDRHMLDAPFGSRKPRFVFDEQGELELIGSPVEAPGFAHRKGLALSAHHWLRRHSGAYEAFRAAVFGWRNRPNADNAEPATPAYSRDELLRLGDALIIRAATEARQAGAHFLLMTNVPRLHRAMEAVGVASLDLSRVIGNEAFELPDGLQHLNEAGNGALTWELARRLRAEGWLDDDQPADPAEPKQ